ncbi:hypothetical protein AB4144_53545, partial [Rhizobiaceae sp. 2RAB30]
TKQGMQEQTAQLIRAIEGVGSRIDGLHERLDRAFDRPGAASVVRQSPASEERGFLSEADAEHESAIVVRRA